MSGTKFGSITKEALIAALEDLPDGAMVAFSSNYGDIHSTKQVHSIRGDIEPERLEESAYSDSGWAIADPWEDPEEEEVHRQCNAEDAQDAGIEQPEIYIIK